MLSLARVASKNGLIGKVGDVGTFEESQDGTSRRTPLPHDAHHIVLIPVNDVISRSSNLWHERAWGRLVSGHTIFIRLHSALRPGGDDAPP